MTPEHVPTSSTPVDEELLHSHLKAALARSRGSLDEARALLAQRHPSPALVWAVRSAEHLMRYFVLAPHYMEAGETWKAAMELGRRDLGSNSWAKAFKLAEQWYGPFDEPLTSDDENAWRVWIDGIVRRRGQLVHGQSVEEATPEEAATVIAFVERMMTWFPQRFLVSKTHPVGVKFRRELDTATATRRPDCP